VTVLTRRPEIVDRYVKTASVVDSVAEGSTFDTVYECGGTQVSLDQSFKFTRMSGKLVVLGYHQRGSRLVEMERWNYNAVDIRNAHFRDMNVILSGFRDAVRLIDGRMVETDDLVSHVFSLADTEAMFKFAAQRPVSFVKAVVGTI
jgi:L-iditol 2-dehydrogenase